VGRPYEETQLITRNRYHSSPLAHIPRIPAFFWVWHPPLCRSYPPTTGDPNAPNAGSPPPKCRYTPSPKTPSDQPHAPNVPNAPQSARPQTTPLPPRKHCSLRPQPLTIFCVLFSHSSLLTRPPGTQRSPQLGFATPASCIEVGRCVQCEPASTTTTQAPVVPSTFRAPGDDDRAAYPPFPAGRERLPGGSP
jgi:hypothetical protein